MEKAKRYCNTCLKECEFIVLSEKDGYNQYNPYQARGSSHVEARDSSHVEANSPYVSTTIKSKSVKAKGGNIVGDKLIPARQWLDKCGVEVKRGYAILYKSVNKDFTSRNGIAFKPKTKHEA